MYGSRLSLLLLKLFLLTGKEWPVDSASGAGLCIDKIEFSLFLARVEGKA